MTAEEGGRVRAEVQATLSRARAWPRFPHALEARFEAETAGFRVTHLLRSGAIMTVVYDAYLVSDIWLISDVWFWSLLAHVVCTVGQAGFLLMIRRGLSPAWREGLQAGVVTVALLSVLVLFFVSRTADCGYMGMAFSLFIVAANAVLRIRFGWSLAFSMLAFVTTTVAALLHPDLSSGVQTMMVMTVGSTTVFTLYANYTMERSQRRSYLLTLDQRLAAMALADANAVLSVESATDFLTGAASRRAFDARMALEWERAAASGETLSLLMVDVDHFKAFNDLHGHQAGDVCLAHVAAVMQQQVRQGRDCLARYGGEEFALILPHAQTADAYASAERIRRAVQERAAAQGGFGASVAVTISVGLATAAPAAGGNTALLIEAADRALYRAKRAGRNQVFPHPGSNNESGIQAVQAA